MKYPTQEDLLGYVLGALDAEQHNELQQKIDQDPHLDEQLLEVKAQLAPLELINDSSGCRPGLARRTCEMVASEAKCDEPTMAAPSFSDTVASRVSMFGKAPWSMTDFLVAAASIGILASLLFPVISYTKYQSRIAHCGNNLRSLGQAFASYAECNDGKFVEIPSAGPLSFFGSFGPMLKDGLFVADDNLFACAGVSRDFPLQIPSCEQIQHCSAGPQYDRYRKESGGDFGYSLGYYVSETYYHPSKLDNTNAILCADKPSQTSIGGPSDNHGGSGQNCLFADLGVRFVKGCSCGEDCIYVNSYNIVGPGVGPQDSVIGASHLSPLPLSSIRNVMYLD